MNTTHQSKRPVVLVGSPRRDGNSATLAQAIPRAPPKPVLPPACIFSMIT